MKNSSLCSHAVAVVLFASLLAPLATSAQEDSDEYGDDEAPLPAVTLTINNRTDTVSIAPGARITVRWSSENVDSCKANWTKKKIKTSGKQSGRLKRSATFIIKCLGEQGQEVTDSVRVVVGEPASEPPPPPAPSANVPSGVPASSQTQRRVFQAETSAPVAITVAASSSPITVGGHSAQAFTVALDGFDRAQITPQKWAQAFYAQYPEDKWDYIAFFTDPIPNPAAYHLWVKNQVKGIGMSQQDDATPFGSAGRLRGIVLLFKPNAPAHGIFNILIHEVLGHSFGVYLGAPLGETVNLNHWSGCVDANTPLGVQYWGLRDWKDNGNGTWTEIQFMRSQRIQRLDPFMLYLSGIIPPEQVPPMQLLTPASGGENECNFKKTITASSKTLAVSDIIATHGPRIPSSATAQKGFSTALVLLVDKKETPPADALAKMAALAAEWPYIVRTALSPITVLPPLIMELKVNGAREVTVPAQSAVTLSWTTQNASSCDLDGKAVATVGTATDTVGASEKLYTLTCYQTGGDHIGGKETALASVGAGGIGVNLLVNGVKAVTVASGSKLTFSWTSASVDTCSFGGASAPSGGAIIFAPASTTVYSIACAKGSNPNAASDSVTVTIAASTPPPPPVGSITVLSPNGGESYKVGDQLPVKWSSVSAGSDVAIEFQKDGKTQIIATTQTPNDGEYSWGPIPSNLVGNGFKARVISLSNPSLSDDSNGVFSVTALSLPPATTTATTTPIIPPPNTIKTRVCAFLGDVAINGEISNSVNSDVDILSSYLAGTGSLTESQKNRADLDGDRSVSGADLDILNRYLAGAVSTFPGCSATPAPVSVDLTANGADTFTDAPGSAVVMSWTSTNAGYCIVEGFTPTTETVDGSGTSSFTLPTTPVTAKITCFSANGAVQKVDTVTTSSPPPPSPSPSPSPSPPPPPTVDLKVNGSDSPESVNLGGTVTLSWTSANAASCSSSGGGTNWPASSRPTSDTVTSDALTAPVTFSISCQSSAGVSTPDSVTVSIATPPPVSYPSFVTTERQKEITGLYRTLLRREPDEGGLKYWDGSGATIDSIRNSFMNSAEYRALQPTSYEGLRLQLGSAFESARALLEAFKPKLPALFPLAGY